MTTKGQFLRILWVILFPNILFSVCTLSSRATAQTDSPIFTLDAPILYSTKGTHWSPVKTLFTGFIVLRNSSKSHLQIEGKSPLLSLVHITFERGVGRGHPTTLHTLINLLSGFPELEVHFPYEEVWIDNWSQRASQQRFLDAHHIHLVVDSSGRWVTLQEAYSLLRWWLARQAPSGFSGRSDAPSTPLDILSDFHADAWRKFSASFSDQQHELLKGLHEQGSAKKTPVPSCRSIMGEGPVRD